MRKRRHREVLKLEVIGVGSKLITAWSNYPGSTGGKRTAIGFRKFQSAAFLPIIMILELHFLISKTSKLLEAADFYVIFQFQSA